MVIMLTRCALLSTIGLQLAVGGNSIYENSLNHPVSYVLRKKNVFNHVVKNNPENGIELNHTVEMIRQKENNLNHMVKVNQRMENALNRMVRYVSEKNPF